jgi:hypothetical protein
MKYVYIGIISILWLLLGANSCPEKQLNRYIDNKLQNEEGCVKKIARIKDETGKWVDVEVYECPPSFIEKHE